MSPRFFSILTLVALFGAGCVSVSVEPKTPPTAPVEAPPSQPTNVQTPTPEPPAPTPTTTPATTPTIPASTSTAPTTEQNPPSQQIVTVTIQNFMYSNTDLVVKKGDLVVFTNADGVTHTATADAGAFDTGLISKGASVTVDTSKLPIGVYAYHCEIHPGMTATLTVE